MKVMEGVIAYGVIVGGIINATALFMFLIENVK